MLRVNINRKDFESRTFSKSQLVKTYKNGSEDYQVQCTCADCSGRGYLTWTSVDSGRCWACNATGKVNMIYHVSDTTQRLLTREEILKNIAEYEEKIYQNNLALGFKKVDFVIKPWVQDVWFNSYSYYRIIKETEKAYLLGRIDNIRESSSHEDTFWVPKKGIEWNA